MFEHLATVAQVQAYVSDSYTSIGRGACRLPLDVASASALMQHAVELSGGQGLTRQELHRIFGPLGRERMASSLTAMLDCREVVKVSESRSNAAGRMQKQSVYYSPSKVPFSEGPR